MQIGLNIDNSREIPTKTTRYLGGGVMTPPYEGITPNPNFAFLIAYHIFSLR